MRIQILHLDPHDDQASARERLRWARAERIVLVWPGHGRVLGRRLDLLLLQREAARQGARLGIVAHDPDVRDHARDLRMPVFDDLDSITADAWPATDPEVLAHAAAPAERAPLAREARPHPLAKPRADDPWRAGWIVFVIAALLLLAVVVGPVAVVEIAPASVAATTEVEVILGASSSDLADIPTIDSRTAGTEVDGELRLPTEGEVMAPVATAQGTALFTNRDPAAQVIPEGTGLRSDGSSPVRFETIDRALLPAGVGSQVRVPIQASAPGTAGNVDAGAITAVEGTLGLLVSVVNPEPTSGGTVEPTPGTTQADVDRAFDALETRLLQEANAQIVAGLEDGEALAPGSMTIEAVLEQEHRPQVGQPSESLAVAMRLRVAAVAYDAEHLEQIAASALARIIDPESALDPETVLIELEPTGTAGRYRAVVRGEAMPRLEAAELASLLAGKPPNQAADFLAENFALERPPRLRLWPEGWPRLPFVPWRVRIVLSTDGG